LVVEGGGVTISSKKVGGIILTPSKILKLIDLTWSP